MSASPSKHTNSFAVWSIPEAFSYTLSTLLLEYIDPAEALGQLSQ